MLKLLDHKTRYLQIAFNQDTDQINDLLPQIPQSERILIEAGTPLIKKYGLEAISTIRRCWSGKIVADLKISDGAVNETIMAAEAGADAITVLGSSPTETINLFLETCERLRIISMIDMLGVSEPLKVLMKLKKIPDIVILHKGRDEESSKAKVIEYKHINKIKSKFDVLISAAGGITLREARSAIFNGANIVVANIVTQEDPWSGISTQEDVALIAKQFLETIE
ncbi:orotidine 5'-phosphate decarboxylase [Candidatus Woesearchaeota archaeon]|nr:orotidine 5'-phosphate decarboxylase [Candidatus Woesearchaeota archaeon]